MYENFEKLMEEKGIRPADVAKATGLRKGFFTDWKMGRSVPKAESLKLIADYFDVPIEFLMTGRMPHRMELDEYEVNLVRAFRKLNPYGKRKIMEDIIDCLQLPKYTEKNSSRSEVV